MKKIIGLVSLFAVITLAACSGKSAEVKKEVIIVPASPVVVIKETEKPTTVIVDKNGVKVVTKKVDLSVKKQ